MQKRIAVFGQAAFGRDVLVGLVDAGHEIAGVYTPPEGRRPDPLAEEASRRGLPLLRHRYFRRKGGDPIAARVDEYRALGAELNVMPFTTAILPPEIVDAPPLGSLCFHPSLLPRYRGGSAIPWQIILGERETGVTIFQPDAGVDTGPIVVQHGGVRIEDRDNAASLYFDKLYPLGVRAMLEAVAGVAEGRACPQPQDESQASFQGLVTDAVARIDWSRPAEDLDRLVRGCDPQPGAHARLEEATVRLYDSRLEPGEPGAAPGTVLGLSEGRLRIAASGGCLSVGKVAVGDRGKTPAAEAPLEPGRHLA